MCMCRSNMKVEALLLEMDTIKDGVDNKPPQIFKQLFLRSFVVITQI